MGKVKPNAVGVLLYEVRRDVRCRECGNLGAVRPYGRYFQDEDKLRTVVTAGGVVPWECLNCGNTGLVGISLEGYSDAFEWTGKDVI